MLLIYINQGMLQLHSKYLAMNESKWVRSWGTGMSTENKFIKKRSAAEINTKCCPQIDSQHNAKLDGTTRKKSKLKSATGNPAFG